MKLSFRSSRGFTLIELMIAVVVTAILATIAVTSYSSFVLKAHRTEAKSALLDMASLEERYMSTNGTYSTNPGDLGYPANVFPIVIGSQYYNVPAAANLSVTAAVVATATPASFTITATAIGNQLKDTACVSFTVTSAGARTATMQGGADNTAACWQ
jgi:type IV pilus assembly protein PilE